MRTFCGLTTDGMLDYLVAVYKIEQATSKVTTSALAEKMHVSPAAVSSMLKRLEEANLVERSNTDGVILTEQGRLAALQLLRRHRLLEVFLVKVMGYTWDQVDVEAHRLEHAVSDAFEERMDGMCNQPSYCPHGEPIPGRDGTVAYEPQKTLLEMQPGELGTVCRVNTDDPQVLRYLARLQLVPGQPIRLTEIAPFHGPIILERLVDSATQQIANTQILGRELAGLLYVKD